MATPQPLIWDIMLRSLRRGIKVSLQEIYDIVEQKIDLQPEDFEPSSDNNPNDLRWQRNVRNILQYRKSTREIHWVGEGEIPFTRIMSLFNERILYLFFDQNSIKINYIYLKWGDKLKWFIARRRNELEGGFESFVN